MCNLTQEEIDELLSCPPPDVDTYLRSIKSRPDHHSPFELEKITYYPEIHIVLNANIYLCISSTWSTVEYFTSWLSPIGHNAKLKLNPYILHSIQRMLQEEGIESEPIDDTSFYEKLVFEYNEIGEKPVIFTINYGEYNEVLKNE